MDALDYSSVAINILNKIAKEKRLPIKSQTFDVKNPLPFADGYFDAVYSHMLFNMPFSEDELYFIFSEIRRVLKPKKGLNFFSVRNHHDKSYGKGIEVDKGIYDIDGFQIRFFTEKQIKDLASAEGFEILWLKEECEEPVRVYLVSSIKID